MPGVRGDSCEQLHELKKLREEPWLGDGDRDRRYGTIPNSFSLMRIILRCGGDVFEIER